MRLIAFLSNAFHSYYVNGDIIKQSDNRIDCSSYHNTIKGLTELLEKHSSDEIMDTINSICRKYIRYETCICEQDVLNYMKFILDMIDEYDMINMKCYISSSYENELYRKISLNVLLLQKKLV